MELLVDKSAYKNYSGIDLEIEFKGYSDNISNYANAILKRLENFVKDFIKMYFNQCNYDEEVLKQAIMYQIDYYLENGDDNRLAPRAYQHLKVNGMANSGQSRYRRYG